MQPFVVVFPHRAQFKKEALMIRHRTLCVAGLVALTEFALPLRATTIMDFPDNAMLKGKAVDKLSPQRGEGCKSKDGSLVQIDDS
jgi:hypothetical protein